MVASIGHGLKLERSDDRTSAGVFSSVGTLYDLTPPGISRDTVDVTSYDSVQHWREHIGGMKDGGEFSIEIEFDPGSADVAAFLADLNNDAAGYYKITYADVSATNWGFAALITGFEPGSPMDDKMSASVTFKLSGKPAYIV